VLIQSWSLCTGLSAHPLCTRTGAGSASPPAAPHSSLMSSSEGPCLPPGGGVPAMCLWPSRHCDVSPYWGSSARSVLFYKLRPVLPRVLAAGFSLRQAPWRSWRRSRRWPSPGSASVLIAARGGLGLIRLSFPVRRPGQRIRWYALGRRPVPSLVSLGPPRLALRGPACLRGWPGCPLSGMAVGRCRRALDCPALLRFLTPRWRGAA